MLLFLLDPPCDGRLVIRSTTSMPIGDDGDVIEELVREVRASHARENDLRQAIAAHNASSDPVERATLRAAAGRLSLELHATAVEGRLRRQLLDLWRAARGDPKMMERLWDAYASADPGTADSEPRKPSWGGQISYEDLARLGTQLKELEATRRLCEEPAERSALEGRVEDLRKQVEAKRAIVLEEEARWWRETGKREYRAEWEFDDPPHAVGPWPGPLDSDD